MQTKLAKAISYIFHPLLMPTYAFILLFNINAYFSLIMPFEGKLRMLALVFIVSFVFPFMTIAFMRYRGVIKSFDISTQSERRYPLIATIGFYIFFYYLILKVNISPIFSYFVFSSIVISITVFFITIFWKISIHMTAIGGVVGMMIGLGFTGLLDNISFIYASIFVAGAIGYARLFLKQHTSLQVYSGFLLGVIAMIYLAIYF